MNITYIFHSGFLVETEHCLLVFDYWHLPHGARLEPADIVRDHLQTNKPVYVFSSHFHEDHFSREIFEWKQWFPHITYILSKDILRRRRAQRDEADVWMAKGAFWADDLLKVTATGSNDSGVSWIVEVEGKRLFHAGDLCNWYARFLADGRTEGVIKSEEFGMINPVVEEKRFLGELKDIRKITDHFDLAMFPVDGRIGNGYTLGGRQFIERFQVGLFVPMHFAASGCESAWRMEPFCKEKNIPFWCIREEGETIEF